MPEEPVAVALKIVSINLLESSFSFDPQRKYPLVSFSHQVKVENGFDVEKNIAISVVHITLTDADGNEILGQVKANLTFEVQDLKQHFQISESGNNEPAPGQVLMATLNSIAISTMRGIMFMSFKGTHLHNAILPIIDPKALNPQVND